jgi:hypothetical protein
MKARYLAFIGTVLAWTVLGSTAIAQSSTVPREIKLSQASNSSPQNTTKPGAGSSSQSAPPPGAAQPPVQQAPQAQVSQQDLQKFANAIKKLQPIQRQAQTQITQAIQQQNFSEKRFGEIYQSRRNPQAQPTAKVTPEESKKFEVVSAKIDQIDKVTQSKMEKTVQEEGLDVKRFNQIFSAIRQDPALLQQVQKMIQS